MNFYYLEEMVPSKIIGISLIVASVIFVVGFMPLADSNGKMVRETITYNQTTVLTSADGKVLSNETETITEINEYPLDESENQKASLFSFLFS